METRLLLLILLAAQLAVSPAMAVPVAAPKKPASGQTKPQANMPVQSQAKPQSNTATQSPSQSLPPANQKGPPPVKGTELQPTLAPIEPEPPKPKNSKSVRLLGGVEETTLAIEWDEWRNRFGRAIEARIFRSAIDGLIIPYGTTAVFHCEVAKDGTISDINITKSSGVLWYDKALLDAVDSLNHSSILKFPEGSQREEVTCDIGMRHVEKKIVKHVYYGDVEQSSLQNKDGSK